MRWYMYICRHGLFAGDGHFAPQINGEKNQEGFLYQNAHEGRESMASHKASSASLTKTEKVSG